MLEMGNHLDVYPILYDITAKTILGNADMYLAMEESDISRLRDIMTNCYMDIPLLNIRVQFEDNYEQETYVGQVLGKQAGNIISLDKNNGKIFLNMPCYEV